MLKNKYCKSSGQKCVFDIDTIEPVLKGRGFGRIDRMVKISDAL